MNRLLKQIPTYENLYNLNEKLYKGFKEKKMTYYIYRISSVDMRKGLVTYKCISDIHNNTVKPTTKEISTVIDFILQGRMCFTNISKLSSWKELGTDIYGEADIFRFDRYSLSSLEQEILQKIRQKYQEDFVYGYGCIIDDNVYIVTKDFATEKTYFTAYYDIHLYNLKTKELKTKSHFIVGESHSSFFVDDIVGIENDSIRLQIRNHLKPYSKCDDEYLAEWLFNTTTGLFEKHPFVFHKRRAERGGDYPTFGVQHLGGYTYMCDENIVNQSVEALLEISRAH